MQILATVTITTIVAIVSGMILFKWQTPSKSLLYKVNPTVPFESENEKLNIYHLEITNAGNSVVEDISSLVKIKSGKILNFSVKAPENIKMTEKKDSLSVELNIQNLNPNERINYSLLMSSNNETFEEPEIYLRGKGIIGSDSSIPETSDFPFYVLPMFIILVASFLSSFLNKKVKKVIKDYDKIKKSGDEQAEILSYLSYLMDLPEEANYYHNSNNDNISYWTESERLTYKAVSNRDQIYTTKIVELFKLILKIDEVDDTIADRTKGIINYNIAKLYGLSGDVANYNMYLDEGNKLTPKLIAERFKIDEKMKTATNNVQNGNTP